MQNNLPDTIQATVNPRLLKKAHRLFTGTLEGRIIEILQNARRAGATQVIINNQDGAVTVTDNGSGIQDFHELLNLGGSGWSEGDENATIEASEDPAGVGLFCLAPRKLIVTSLGKQVVIEDGGWHGEPVALSTDGHATTGTTLQFADEPWTFDVVQPLAAYTGMLVEVDGKACIRLNFIDGNYREYPELGVRIKVVSVHQLPPYCENLSSRRYSRDMVFLNFHGQVVALDFQPIERHELAYLIELTGRPTQVRLMLPARTRLIENESLTELKSAIEFEAYDYLRIAGRHKLAYTQFERAKELGITLPEAVPDFTVGLLGEDGYGLFPVEVNMPEGWLLSHCYRMSADADDDEMSGTANAHLLAAYYRGKLPFVPVTIHQRYDGYSWADLSRITSVNILPGQTQFDDWVGSHTLTCVDELRIEVATDDGQRFAQDVPMAVRPVQTVDDEQTIGEEELYLTPAARGLRDQDIWYHAGGYCEEGDSWDTQLHEFGKELAAFWATLDGPDEALRRKVMEMTWSLPSQWQSLIANSDGTVELRLEDGSIRVMRPPSQPTSGQGGAA